MRLGKIANNEDESLTLMQWMLIMKHIEIYQIYVIEDSLAIMRYMVLQSLLQ